MGGSLHADQAQIESAKLNLDYARVTAPIDGVTGVAASASGGISVSGGGLNLTNVMHGTDVGMVERGGGARGDRAAPASACTRGSRSPPARAC